MSNFYKISRYFVWVIFVGSLLFDLWCYYAEYYPPTGYYPSLPPIWGIFAIFPMQILLVLIIIFLRPVKGGVNVVINTKSSTGQVQYRPVGMILLWLFLVLFLPSILLFVLTSILWLFGIEGGLSGL